MDFLKPENEMDGIRWWHRIALPDGRTTPGYCDHVPSEARWGLPRDLTGRSVLDVGTWDGLFAFECERRGAKTVVAVDVPQGAGGHGGEIFGGALYAKKALGSNVSFRPASIAHLDKTFAGFDAVPRTTFDLVLCYGVLYHLTDMVAGIRGLAAATKPGGRLLIETAYALGPGCQAEYRPGFDGDDTNYWYPTKACLARMLEREGFRNLDVFWEDGVRLSLRATRG